jgi:tRNA A37 threonylcarbamoyladenosine dehydratase
MAERILAINPECRVTCIDDFITADNVAELLDNNFSYVIDAIDSVRRRRHCWLIVDATKYLWSPLAVPVDR